MTQPTCPSDAYCTEDHVSFRKQSSKCLEFGISPMQRSSPGTYVLCKVLTDHELCNPYLCTVQGTNHQVHDAKMEALLSWVLLGGVLFFLLNLRGSAGVWKRHNTLCQHHLCRPLCRIIASFPTYGTASIYRLLIEPLWSKQSYHHSHTFLMSSSASSFWLIMMWLTQRLAKTIAGTSRILLACFFTVGS